MKDKWGPILIGLVVVAVLTGVAMRYRLIPEIDPTETVSKLAMALEMVYEDGTTRIIDPSSGGFLSLMRPLSILDDTGKELSEINYVVKIQTKYTGQFHAGSIHGTITYQVNDVTKDSHDFESLVDFGSGEWVRVETGGLTKYALRDWGKIGSNSLRIICQATVEVVFDDGTVDSMSGYGGVVVTYQETSDSGITALSITVSPSFLY